MKAQQALERIIEHMEAEKEPQALRLAELQTELQTKDEAMKLLEKSHQEVSNDREAISTLLALSKVQLETSLQANKVLETRVQYATSGSTGSSGREVELEQQLALQKALVDAQRLESYNMFSELQGLKAELAALKQSMLQQPMPTQQSLHASKAASTSLPRKGISDPPPSVFSDMPT